MLSAVESIEILSEILSAKEPIKTQFIKSFQNDIWDEKLIKNELYEILSELAYDLDFYEPNEEWRKEYNGYYGCETLEAILKKGIDKIVDYTKSIS